MDEKELKEFMAWFSKATGVEDQAKLDEIISGLDEDETKEVMNEWSKYKQTRIAKNGMKCPKGEIPRYFKVGGVLKECGCKKVSKFSKEVLEEIKSEFLKCGGKMKKINKK